MNKDFKEGFQKGIPIGIGYLSVSVAFGMMVKNAQLPISVAIFISATNLTSAGQFAGLNLIVANASYLEIAMTTLIINLRYALMSLSLSQKVEEKMSRLQRAILSFGVTDEIFALSISSAKPITFAYYMGIVCPSFIGWVSGSGLGAIFSNILPSSISDAMSIALYAMFVAIIMPTAKEDIHKRKAVIWSIVLSCLFAYVPILKNIGSGWTIILITIIVSGIMAFVYPIKEES